MRPFRPIILLVASVQHPQDYLLLNCPRPLQFGESLGMSTVTFFFTFHFQDHRAQIGGRLPQGFILVGMGGEDVGDVG